jgi:hypothetical protein
MWIGSPTPCAQCIAAVPIPDDLMATLRPLAGMGLVVDGTIVPSDAPGFGVELKLSDIERATV